MSTLFTPYIDVSVNAEWSDWQNYPNGRPNPVYSKQVIDWDVSGLILAFITLSVNNTACWAAQPTMPLDWAVPLAEDINFKDKKVIISFGGASNNDISTKFTVSELEKVYLEVIELYNAAGLDFDLENGLYNLDKICDAIKLVQATKPDINISFTLPTMPEGLVSTGLDIINKAKEKEINFIINAMAMDYYQGTDNNMGEAAVDAAKNIKIQLGELYPTLTEQELYTKIAITPMIGLNDDLSMFTVDDVNTLATFAKKKGLKFLATWSFNRDNPSIYTYVDLTTSSNPNQKESGDYSKRFVNELK